MTKDEALKMALEALEEAWYHVGTFQPTEKAIDLYDEARTALKEALAQPEQEPVAWMDDYNACKCSDNETRCFSDRVFRMMQKYTAPPQRTWVGLTRTELIKCGVLPFGMSYELCQAIEDKLKEKNT